VRNQKGKFVSKKNITIRVQVFGDRGDPLPPYNCAVGLTIGGILFYSHTKQDKKEEAVKKARKVAKILGIKAKDIQGLPCGDL